MLKPKKYGVYGIFALQLTLPPWGIYRKSPLNWQKARPQAEDIGSTTAQQPSSAAKSKKKK